MQLAGAPQRRGRFSRYLAPLALAALVTVTALVVLKGLHGSRGHAAHAVVLPQTVRHLGPYWFVHPGDTLGGIAQKTHLTIAQLEAFNPNTDPNNLVPGQRLNLWAHPPVPRRTAPGARFWTIRPGDSLGLIAAKTGVGLSKLEELNPKLQGATLQPGERVRLSP